jgi:hypothetical protein
MSSRCGINAQIGEVGGRRSRLWRCAPLRLAAGVTPPSGMQSRKATLFSPFSRASVSSSQKQLPPHALPGVAPG